MKYSEQEIRQLIDENELLKMQIGGLNAKLEEAEKYKSHFLSNIRNTIINPFASIVGLSEEITRVDKRDWKKVISLAALIHSEAYELDFQLKNIFCAADIECGEIYPEHITVNVIPIVERIVTHYRMKIMRKKLTVFVNEKIPSLKSTELFFVSDPKLLYLVFTNIIDNAIKFSTEGTKIMIEITVDDGRLSFQVFNEGKVIPNAEKRKIFDRFQKLNGNINSLESGNGLGLSIVKALLDLMNGSITFESDKDEGTAFCILIPKGSKGGMDTGINDGFATEDIEIF